MFFSLHFEVELKCLYKYVNGVMISLSTAIALDGLRRVAGKSVALL